MEPFERTIKEKLKQNNDLIKALLIVIGFIFAGLNKFEVTSDSYEGILTYVFGVFLFAFLFLAIFSYSLPFMSSEIENLNLSMLNTIYIFMSICFAVSIVVYFSMVGILLPFNSYDSVFIATCFFMILCISTILIFAFCIELSTKIRYFLIGLSFFALIIVIVLLTNAFYELITQGKHPITYNLSKNNTYNATKNIKEVFWYITFTPLTKP